MVFLKKLFYNLVLKYLFNKAQKYAQKKLKLRDQSIEISQKFAEVIEKLKDLGVHNPKEVLGDRPKTGEIE